MILFLLKDVGKPDWLVQWEECSQKIFAHLCDLVNQDTPAEGPETLLKGAAKEAILDGKSWRVVRQITGMPVFPAVAGILAFSYFSPKNPALRLLSDREKNHLYRACWVSPGY